jgi:hypothetical protein
VLLRWARAAGFTALELDYRAEVEVPEPLPTTDWDVLKKIAPNPLAPTFEEALAQTLTDGERDRFESHVRAVLAAVMPVRKTLATAYLRATRRWRLRVFVGEQTHRDAGAGPARRASPSAADNAAVRRSCSNPSHLPA